ncbi:MAG: BatD family protein [Moheibacter sp.]
MFKTILNILFISCTTLFVYGQEVTFNAQASKEEVSVNERFIVRFVLTYGQKNVSVDKAVSLPDFNGLHQLGESQINSFQFVNGNVINQTGLEVMLVADQEGDYTIGNATVTINGKKYKTDPIKISVKKGLKPKVSPGKRLQGAFLTTEISEENPFLNQEVILTVKVYARDYSILNRLRNFQEPDFSNLIAKYVSEQVPDSEKQVLVEGKTYISKELARYILFPQKSGEIDIDPFALNVLISGMFGSENVELTSEPITLQVKNLPSGKPENFSGAVGHYNLNAFLSKKEVNSGEAINLDVEIIGSGNLNTLKTPEVSKIENIETYAPKRKNAFSARPSGFKGKIEETYILVPEYGGNYKVGPVAFNYFDPKQEKYITLQTKPFDLEVDGPQPPKKDTLPKTQELSDHIQTDSTTYSIGNKSENPTQTKESSTEETSYRNYGLWGGIVLIGLTFIGLIFFLSKKKKSTKNKSDIANKSQQKAQFKSSINNQLTQLKSLAKNQEKDKFLSLQEDILTQIGMFFSNTSLSDFTENTIAEKLKQGYGDDLANRWKTLLLECKQSKYAFGNANQNLVDKFSQTESLWKSFLK